MRRTHPPPAARWIKALKKLTDGRIRFAGIGGEAMRAEGLPSLFPQADLAVMGFAEVVPRIPKILARLRQTLADIAAKQPSLIITVDSWGFTGRVAKALKKSGSAIPRLHYVAPMVWAWKEKRARTLAECVDRLLCLLQNQTDVRLLILIETHDVVLEVSDLSKIGKLGSQLRRDLCVFCLAEAARAWRRRVKR